MFLSGFEVWRASRATDGQGGWTETYAKNADVAGRLTPLSGGETIRADQERGVITHRFSCASSASLIKGDQVRVGSRVLRVEAVQRTSSGRRIEAVCEEDT